MVLLTSFPVIFLCFRHQRCAANQSSMSPANLVRGQTVPLLDLSLELILAAVDDVEIIVGQLTPLSLSMPFACFQFPSTRFQSIYHCSTVGIM
jgi:hypothetical protein